MVGRLIVALLVIASAAFVMLQRRATESTDIKATITATRAKEADDRALALEEQVKSLRDQMRALEHDIEWQREQLHSLAADCTPMAADQPDVEIVKVTRRPPTKNQAWTAGQRVGLVLAGDEATITRVRVFTSLDDGTPLNDFVSCDTANRDHGLLLGVIANGRDVVKEFGQQNIAKRRGAVPFELVCDSNLDADKPLTVELLLAGGATARATVPATVNTPAPRR